LNVKTKAYI